MSVMSLDKPWTGDPEQEPTLDQALAHASLDASSRMEKRLAQAYMDAWTEIEALRNEVFSYTHPNSRQWILNDVEYSAIQRLAMKGAARQ
jgi:hypothetical protein